MNVEIKKAIKAGNSSAVLLPRAWLNREVRVELVKKTPKIILQETISLLEKYIETNEIIGIYLVGSYARNEESKESDIDILVISSDTDKEMINEGIYNILIVSENLLKWKLENDLLPIGPMLREAKVLINSTYLNSIKIKVTKKNIEWYIDTTYEKLKLIKKALENTNKKVNDRITYSLVLRIRTLYLIQQMSKNKIYSKKELINLLRRISGSNNAYESYLAVKNDEEESYKATKEEAEKLYEYLKKQLRIIKMLKRDKIKKKIDEKKMWEEWLNNGVRIKGDILKEHDTIL